MAGCQTEIMCETTGVLPFQLLQVPSRERLRFLKPLLVDLLAFFLIFALPAILAAQFQLGFGELDAEENADSSGAILKTDPDLEATLATAERFKNDGNYRVATQLYQTVLERSGDALYSSDGELYFSLVRQVERILADLPPAGLTAYRVVADAEAKEILARADHPLDPAALNQIVNEYFISSLGDDAAFQLGSIYLDQFDFIGACRMFEKILKQYPQPSVPLDQVWVRLALSQSYLGQLDAAQESLAQARELGGNRNMLDQIESSLGQLSARRLKSAGNVNWHTRLGNSRRDGVMQAPPADFLDTDLVAAWQYYFQPLDKYDWKEAQGEILVGRESYEAAGKTRNDDEKKMIAGWSKKNWRPRGQLLLDHERIYFKSAADMAVWNSKHIAELIENKPDEPKLADAIDWRSVWRNHFELDDATRIYQSIQSRWGSYQNQNKKQVSSAPESTSEIQLFGDDVQQRMSIVKGVLYSLEGKHFDKINRFRPEEVNPQWNASYRRTRSNFLTAYDAVTGEVQWTLPKEGDDSTVVDPTLPPSPWLDNGGFMSAPIGYGDWILAPVNIGGSITVYALDPANGGRTVWKSFLCDEPEGGAENWAAIDLTIDGSDLFVNTGMGVVFVLDPATGRVRFAKRYPRAQRQGDNNLQGWKLNQSNFDGWSNDVIIPYGRQMICFSSDSETIRAIDRNTGEIIWQTEMKPLGFKVDYLLGVYNDILYAAGTETIIAYDLQGQGRMIWGAEQMFDEKISHGRGVLTPRGIYMPVENAIYQFELPVVDDSSDGAGSTLPIAKVEVRLGTDAPVGNLYSDGQRLWVHGGNRLYALAPKPKPTKK